LHGAFLRLQLPGSLFAVSRSCASKYLARVRSTTSGGEPIAWTRIHNGGRVFYTSLGHPEAFENANFRRMWGNALFWTANRKNPEEI